MEISRGVGISLQLDQSYGFYARVLVDIDLTSNQPSFFNVERDDHRGFSVDVIYEDLPERCTKCKTFGHDSARCYQKHKEINYGGGRSRSRNPMQTYRPITKTNTIGMASGIEYKIQDQSCDAQTVIFQATIMGRVILDNPRIRSDQQVLDRISKDKRGISEDLVFDNNWIPVVTKSKRKVKPTFKILFSSKSEISKGSSYKRLPAVETKIRSDYAASAAQAELSLVANWAAQIEAERNDSANLIN
ncbi:hypothetical protein Dsin_001072 [Dipteronia sinensis]|uniref:Uncharacterized protein n=1 Tax=Dipteronia sinensis TaxID=43782 RepID=A0AAE0EI35_9ROSI|nr:hypothetical protein Dsin_001072 [Dipteronia sinensis]